MTAKTDGTWVARVSVAVALVVLSACSPLLAQGVGSGLAVPKVDCWMGLYYGDLKVGYSHTSVSRAKFEGREVYRKDEVVEFRARFSGKKKGFTLRHTICADDALNPVYELISGKDLYPAKRSEALMSFEARYGPKTLRVKTNMEGKVAERTSALSDEDRALAVAGIAYEFGTKALKPGDEFRLYHLCKRSFLIEPAGPQFSYFTGTATISVLRTERVDVLGQARDAVVLEDSYDAGKLTRWQLEDGTIVRETSSAGNVTWRLETRQEAMKMKPADGPEVGGK